MKAGKLSNIVLLLLLVVSIVVMVMFYFGGYVDNNSEIPTYTELALNWTNVLLGLSIVVTLLFFLYKLFSDFKNSLRTLFGILIMVIIFSIAYSIGSGDPLVLEGYTGEDNVYGKLKLADMMIYTSLIFIIGTLASIVIGEVIKRVRT